jgi:hypothetical protein
MAVNNSSKYFNFPNTVIKAGTGGRTFFASEAGANIEVSAGAINNKIVEKTIITAPSDGDKVWIEITVIASTGRVTSAEVESGATVPDDTETKGHKVLATIAVDDGKATPTNLGWNFTEVQKCGPTTYYWGGIPGG